MAASTSGSSWNHIVIRELKPGIKNVNVEFMILEPVGMNHTKDGSNVYVFKIADATAAINLAVIGDNGQYLRPGDICRVYNGFATVFKGALTFYVGRSGELKRIGEFCYPICEDPYLSTLKYSPVDHNRSQQQNREHSKPGGTSESRPGTSSGSASQLTSNWKKHVLSRPPDLKVAVTNTASNSNSNEVSSSSESSSRLSEDHLGSPEILPPKSGQKSSLPLPVKPASSSSSGNNR